MNCPALLTLGLALAVVPGAGASAETIVIAGSQDFKATSLGEWLDRIYTEAFRRLGYDFRYEGFPTVRAEATVQKGLADGDINRVYSYQDSHPELVRVEESHFQERVSAFAVRPGLAFDGWASLAKGSWQVGYRRGSKTAEAGLIPGVPPDRLSAVTTTAQGLSMLRKGRIDVYVEVETLVEDTLRNPESDLAPGPEPYPAGLMQAVTGHLYLTARRADLAPRVSAVLRAMKQEGLVEQYRKQAFGPGSP